MSADTPGPESAPDPPAVPIPPAVPVPPAAPASSAGSIGDGPVPAAAESSPPTEPAAPPVTASGLPNPHGLPEIAVERPEVAIGAAFAGGLVLAMILKRLGR